MARSPEPPAAHRKLWPALLLASALTLPFINKPFHIDDPVYVWVAEQITREPLDFYGFDINWHGTPESVAKFNQNPPLYSYSLALPGILLGFSEPVMHLVNWGWLLLLLAGVHRLAGRYCQNSGWATLLTTVLPVTIVCAQSVMCDIAMLALYVWSIALWLEGLDRRSLARIAGATLLIAAAGLTKYFAVSLIPLLLVRSLLKREDRWSLGLLVIPVAIWGGYEFLTRQMYFAGGVSRAADYVVNQRLDPTNSVVNGLCFLGGLTLPACGMLLVTSPWKHGVYAFIAAQLATVGYTASGVLKPDGVLLPQPLVCTVAGTFFALGGLAAVRMLLHIYRHRTPDVLLLVLWLAGTLVFSGFLNWTVNARSQLATAVPLSILAIRQLEAWSSLSWHMQRFLMRTTVILGSCLTAAVGYGDYMLAVNARDSALEFQKTVTDLPEGRKVWFEGHWGFQYYMEKLGYLPLDMDEPAAQPGDLIVLPQNNSGVPGIPEPLNFAYLRYLKVENPSLVAVMDVRFCSGFYSSQWGDLPYMLSLPAPSLILIAEVRPREAPPSGGGEILKLLRQFP